MGNIVVTGDLKYWGNYENTPCFFSYFFICYLISEFVWSQQISLMLTFLATEARVHVMKGIRLLITSASNEM